MTQQHTMPTDIIRLARAGALALLVGFATLALPAQAANGDVVVPVGRSELVSLAADMGEIIVSNPEVADVHVHGPREVSVIGKKIGRTNVRIFDESKQPISSFDVQVSYDIPAIRKALNTFLPEETVAVEMVNTNLALTGDVSSAAAADRAVKIVDEFMKKGDEQAGATDDTDEAGNRRYKVLNLLQVTSGQQVMLRVRVGEIKRSAIKQLGVNLSAFRDAGDSAFKIGTGGGIAPFLAGSTLGFGGFEINPDSRGILSGSVNNGNSGLAGMLEALEVEGLFKVLAEPNLVAISGEKAEFLAGGEFPVPISEGGTSNTNNTVTVQYKPFGVAVQFTPYVLTENRIRIVVQPEVSELSNEGAVRLNDFEIPALTTRRAKTTVELAPGESFMIAGLISDNFKSQINQLPGLGEVPVLGALFRSTAFERNETELVMAVTPYIVDPLKASDIKLPTDNMQPASVMESFFYGALGTLSGNALTTSQTPQLEGPIGFMVD